MTASYSRILRLIPRFSMRSRIAPPRVLIDEDFSLPMFFYRSSGYQKPPVAAVPLKPAPEGPIVCGCHKDLAHVSRKVQQSSGPVLVQFAESIVQHQERCFVALFLEIEEFCKLQRNKKCLVLALRCELPQAQIVNAKINLVPMRSHGRRSCSSFLVPMRCESLLKLLLNLSPFHRRRGFKGWDVTNAGPLCLPGDK